MKIIELSCTIAKSLSPVTLIGAMAESVAMCHTYSAVENTMTWLAVA